MKTTTIYRRIAMDTVRLVRLLKRIANRPRLSRAAGYSADEIQAELEWRAAMAMQ